MSIFSNSYTTEQKVQAVFVGLLGRNAKTSGLDHYVAAIDNPNNNYGIAEMLSELVNTQPEYAENVDGLGRAQVVSYIFNNLFGRDPAFDTEGNNYWINGDGAAVPVDQLVTAIIDGASAQDQLVLENKVSVAIYMEQNPGLTDAQAKDILATVTSSLASINAAKAAVDAGLDPTGQDFVLTGGLDNFTGTSKNDTFRAEDDDLETGDNLKGMDGDDTLIWSVDGDSDYYFAAPTLASIETIRINAPNIYDTWINLDLFNASGYETIEFFNITNFYGGEDDNYVSVYDVQNVNDTNFRFIDTDIGNYEISYDTNAYITPNGGDDDIAELYFSEVNGSSLWFYNENTGGEDSNVDVVEITSAQRNQINDTTFNYLYDIHFGEDLNTVMIYGDDEMGHADLEVEDYLDWNVNLVDASDLEADLTLDLYAQRLVWDGGIVDADATTVLTYIGAQGDDNLDVGGGEDGISVIDLGTGNDDLTVGEIGYYGEDPMLGHTTVIAGAGHDRVSMSITGLQDISLGDGNDDLSIYGDVDDLTTLAANDGVGLIDAGAGDDYVYVGGYGEDMYSTGAYDIDLGAGHDELLMYVNGDPTVTAGAGNDTAVINVLSDVTFFGNDGDDDLTINGDGVHFIDMGNGHDSVDINGDNVSGPGDFVDYGDDTITVIMTGTGNDSVDVSHNHYLDVTLGEGDDQITLRAEDLTSDDVIRGDEEIDTQEGADTMILTNANGEWVYVTDSETAGVVGFETFDLRNQNIEFHVTEQMFDTAAADSVTVSTRLANGVSLPVLYTAAGVMAAEQFDQGMSREEYEEIREKMADGDYFGIPATTDVEDYLLDNGVNIIDFVDDDLSDDADQVTEYGDDPIDSDDESEDSVFFQLEPEGEMVIDITDATLTALNGREFTLLGGNIKDVVVADDASINGRATLLFDDNTANNSIHDTLIVEGAATITAADLRNVEGLEIIVLKSDANSGQNWAIELTDRVINQTTGSATLYIKVDPEVPAGSRLDITLDDSVHASTNDVVIEGNSNIEVYINGVLASTSEDYNDGLNTITFQNSLYFTTNADDLQGEGNFYLLSANQIQSTDTAIGFGEDDTMYVGFAPSNYDDSLHDQFEGANIEGIEHLIFTRNDFTGLTANSVRMSSIGIGSQFFDNLETFTTGTGEDFLGEMEGENDNGDVIQYYLNAGDDFFDGEDSDHYWVDAGAGNDSVFLGENADDSTVYGGDGNDSIVTGEGDDFIDGGAGNDTIYSSSGDDTIYGEDGNDLIYADYGDDDIYGGSGNDTIYGEDGNDYIDGGAGNDSLIGGSGNDSIHGGEGNNYIEGNDGNDSITSGSGNDTIDGGAGNDYISSGAGNDVINTGTGAGNETVNAGDGNDSITLQDILDSSDDIDGGAGNDTLTLTTAQTLLDVDFTNVDNLEVLNLSSGADTLVADSLFEATGITTINAGSGSDNLNFREITNATDLVINTGAGADSVVGGAGDDSITVDDNAGVGFNFITGASGADTIDLTLSTGQADYLVFELASDGALTGQNTGHDIIRGFESGVDRIIFDDDVVGFPGIETAIRVGGMTVIENDSSLDITGDVEVALYTNTALTNGQLEQAGFTDVLNFLNNSLAFADAGDAVVYAVAGTTDTALYFYQENSGDNVIDISEIRLLGVVEGTELAAGDFYF